VPQFVSFGKYCKHICLSVKNLSSYVFSQINGKREILRDLSQEMYRNCRMAQVAEGLPGKLEAQSSNQIPVPPKKTSEGLEE
jgi:hypothetical protein